MYDVMRGSRARSERGAVVVMVAALMPLFVLLLAFAVDASHWWVHKAHLQTQVDSGAFAGALGPWLPVCDPDLEQKARQYSGDYSGAYTGPDPLFNDQYSNETNVHVLINSATFESQGGANYSEEGLSPCDSLNSPTDPDKPAYLDLKATESDLPNFLGQHSWFQRPAMDFGSRQCACAHPDREARRRGRHQADRRARRHRLPVRGDRSATQPWATGRPVFRSAHRSR